jgi:hypothetical protein
VIHAFDELSLPRFAGNTWVSCRMEDQLGLLKRIPLSNVPQELKETQIPWQVDFADAPNHSPGRLCRKF